MTMKNTEDNESTLDIQGEFLEEVSRQLCNGRHQQRQLRYRADCWKSFTGGTDEKCYSPFCKTGSIPVKVTFSRLSVCSEVEPPPLAGSKGYRRKE